MQPSLSQQQLFKAEQHFLLPITNCNLNAIKHEEPAKRTAPYT